MIHGDDDCADLCRDEYRDRPRGASKRQIAERLNVMATALSFLAEQVSEIRHELGVRERLDVVRKRISSETGR
jgi:hypothetical protein